MTRKFMVMVLVDDNVVDCMLGIRAPTRRGAAVNRIERAGAEKIGVGWPVFGKQFFA